MRGSVPSWTHSRFPEIHSDETRWFIRVRLFSRTESLRRDNGGTVRRGVGDSCSGDGGVCVIAETTLRSSKTRMRRGSPTRSGRKSRTNGYFAREWPRPEKRARWKSATEPHRPFRERQFPRFEHGIRNSRPGSTPPMTTIHPETLRERLENGESCAWSIFGQRPITRKTTSKDADRRVYHQ